MSDLAIVAIPKKDDYVWNVSSEKVPHMTILYLGEQEFGQELALMADFVEHTVNTTMKQFFASVIKRGTLGDDDADVVFFDKMDVRNVNRFRNYLLTNRYIKAAFDSVDQYPEWTPHLTLGYPATPAKKDTREYPGINYVGFDKIAFWTDDYAGLEYELGSPWDEETMEVSMSELKHYGVKGMKWGVRRSAAELSKKRSQPSEDYTKSRKLKKNPSKTLSNKEMKTVINRLSLEKQMGELNKSAVDRGHDKVKKYLAIATTLSTAYALSQSPMGKAIKSKLTK